MQSSKQLQQVEAALTNGAKVLVLDPVDSASAGTMVDKAHAQAATSKPLWWVRLDLRPDIPAPIAMMCRLSHRHVDSTQGLYCGLAFELAHSADQRQFIIELFARYTDELQRRQARAQAKVG